MRLDKYLAHAGYGSRKEVKQAIRKGLVRINEVECRKDDTRIQEGIDVVCVNGEEVVYEAVVYIMLNKPQDVVSATSDPTHETVLDCIDAILPRDCFPVGRLDIDTEGLLLITNDGKLAHRLLSPKNHVVKTYFVQLAKPLQEADKKRPFNVQEWSCLKKRRYCCISRRDAFIRSSGCCMLSAMRLSTFAVLRWGRCSWMNSLRRETGGTCMRRSLRLCRKSHDQHRCRDGSQLSDWKKSQHALELSG